MHHTTDRVKGFYAKTKKPACLNLSLLAVPLLCTLRLKSALRTGHAELGMPSGNRKHEEFIFSY